MAGRMAEGAIVDCCRFFNSKVPTNFMAADCHPRLALSGIQQKQKNRNRCFPPFDWGSEADWVRGQICLKIGEMEKGMAFFNSSGYLHFIHTKQRYEIYGLLKKLMIRCLALMIMFFFLF